MISLGTEFKVAADCLLYGDHHLTEGCVTPGDDHCHTIQGDAQFGFVKAAVALERKGFQATLQGKKQRTLTKGLH